MLTEQRRADGAAHDRGLPRHPRDAPRRAQPQAPLRQQVHRAAAARARATCGCPCASASTSRARSDRRSTRRRCAQRSPRCAARGRRGDRRLLHARLRERRRTSAARRRSSGSSRPASSSRSRRRSCPQVRLNERVCDDGDERLRRPGAAPLRRAARRAALASASLRGALLVMQSNGGVATPEIVTRNPASTVLSGPAGGPVAGLAFARAAGSRRTASSSTWAARASTRRSSRTARCRSRAQGEINRHAIALPMIDVHTIGAGGGSIGWLDEGGAAAHGPAERRRRARARRAYGRGGDGADLHRRRPRARLHRPGLLPRRPDAARAWSGARAAVERADRGAARARRRRGRRGDGRGDQPDDGRGHEGRVARARLRPARAPARRRRRRGRAARGR